MQHRIALVGCGHIGKKHAELAARYGELVAVADVLPTASGPLAERFQVPAYSSIEEMLSQQTPGIVVVATPNSMHAEHSITALSAGAHVLCEKPMAISSADAQQMIRTAEMFNKHLYVVKQNRFNPPVQFVKELLRTDALGKLLGFQLNAFWNRSPAYYNQSSWRGRLLLDGGPLFTQFSHFIDLLYWTLGELESVRFADGQNTSHAGIIEFEDQGLAAARFRNGITGTIQYTLNSYLHNMEGSLTLFGEKGTIKIGGTYLQQIDYFSVEGKSMPSFEHIVGANRYPGYEGSSSLHHLVYEEFLARLSDPKVSPASQAAEAAQSVAIIESIYKTMRERTT